MGEQVPVKKLTICDIPISEYAVVCPDPMEECVRQAVDTLVELVWQGTGCRLPVIGEAETAFGEILIGTTDRDTPAVKEARASLKNDGYAILTEGARLFLTGRIPRGVSYGIYGLLEDYLGVRFYASDCTVIHEAERIDIPRGLVDVQNPGFEYRDVCWYDYIKDHAFASRNKVNNANVRRTDVPDAGIYAGDFVHTLAGLNGEAVMVDVQPCLTDEVVYQRVLSNVRKRLAEHPEASIISVSQNDSHDWGLGCQCPRCRAIDEAEGSPMGSLLTFVNRIANEIREEYPKVLVDTLAYRYTRKPPRTIVPAENVVIRLCSIECCFAHGMGAEGCKDNEAFRQNLEDWSRISRRLYVWDYVTDFSHYLAPFPNLKVLRENIRFLKEHHVEGLLEEGNFQSHAGEFEELRGYLLAKLLWNPYMEQEEYEALMDEFLKDYYGRGWCYIREYIDATSKRAAEGHLHIYNEPEEILPPEDETAGKGQSFAQKMTGLWERALEAADTEEQKRHVRKSRIQNEYYLLYTDFDHQKERSQELWESLQEFGITRHNEAYLLPQLEDGAVSPRLWSAYAKKQAQERKEKENAGDS